MHEAVVSNVQAAIEATIRERIDLINNPERLLANLPAVPSSVTDVAAISEYANAVFESVLKQVGFEVPPKLLMPAASALIYNSLMTEIDVVSAESVTFMLDPLALGFLPQEMAKFIKPFNHPPQPSDKEFAVTTD